MTETNESCMVCHASTRLVPTEGSHALAYATGTQQNLSVAIVSATESAGHPQITFTVSDGAWVTNVTSTDTRFYIAGLTPGTASDYFDRWAQERSGTYDPDGADTGVGSQPYPWGTLTNNGSGSYTYTFAALTGDRPAASTIQRIFLRVSKSGKNTGNVTYDFDPSDLTTSVANPRDIVPSARCNSCHYERIGDHGHGGGYNQTNVCVVCHSPLLDETGWTPTPHDMRALGFDFPTMIHQIHSAKVGPDVDWSEITYPNNMKDCVSCHSGGTASDNWKTKPSQMACGGCHQTVNFSDHPGTGDGPKADGSCTVCHTATGITNSHSLAPTGMNVPEFDAELSVSPAPANGTHYTSADGPIVVTVKLKNHPDGTPVPASVYTTARDAVGVAGGGLREARLYVYGPRSSPKPALTAGAALTPPAQYTQMFVNAADPKVLTDGTGFRYQLNAIPADMTAGTYMIRFQAADYGYVSNTNYKTPSPAFRTIQIGTATAQKKISGDCKKCHGNTNATWHDPRVNVDFDSDKCIACHDLSGNHAAPLANRVHAVHSSSVTGDINGFDWSEVLYPVRAKSGGVQKCSVCHDSGSTQYNQNVADFSCRGCHADKPGATDHMRQNGGQY